MRRILVMCMLVLAVGCTSRKTPANDRDTMTKRQKDSVFGASGLPGASAINKAQAAADSLDAQRKRMDSIAAAARRLFQNPYTGYATSERLARSIHSRQRTTRGNRQMKKALALATAACALAGAGFAFAARSVRLLRNDVAHPVRTSIRRGRAGATRGKWSVSTPSLSSAWIPAESTSSGSSNCR